MLDIKSILVATDFGDCSISAVQLACALAEKFGASLHVLYVEKEAMPYHGYEFEPSAELQAQLDQLPGHPWNQQIQVTRSMRVGPPAEEIVAEAEDRGADMIVIGTHGRGGVSKMILGSVAERVVRTAPCPVVTARGK